MKEIWQKILYIKIIIENEQDFKIQDQDSGGTVV